MKMCDEAFKRHMRDEPHCWHEETPKDGEAERKTCCVCKGSIAWEDRPK